jgi:hypothetical protein
VKFDLLLRHAADLGVDVDYANLSPTRHGEYRHHESLIVLNRRCTAAQMLSALAHEIGHAVACDHGTKANHAKADEYGAALIITPAEYAAAEAEVGEHAGALAEYLGVTRRLVLAWRRWYARTH